MPEAVKIDYVATGIVGFDQALSQLGRKSLIRRAVNVPAQRALQPVRGTLKERSKRTHPRSRLRPSTAGEASARARAIAEGKSFSRGRRSHIGPMSRYVSIRPISARSPYVGARLFYDTRVFPGFAVEGRNSGKRAFYPAAQEYGAKTARPTIKPRFQMRSSAEAGSRAAVNIFINRFRENYEKVAEEVFRRSKG